MCLISREMQPLVSPHQESVSWRDHDVIFSRTFFQLIQEQTSHQSVREIDSTTNKNLQGRPMEFSYCWVWTTAWYPYKILRIKPYSTLSLSPFSFSILLPPTEFLSLEKI